MTRKRLVIILLHGKLFILWGLLFCIGFGFWLLNQPAIWTSIPLASFISGRIVAIDAGHGGGDPGAKTKSGLAEKHLNLDVALRLKKYLSRVGVYCIMIRETDIDYFEAANGTKKQRDLNHRVHIANESKADIFISIHANSFPQIIYHGAQTFFNKESPHSKKLAEAIQAQLVRRLGPNHRKAKSGDYRILNFTKMPGVIVEIGFLSNEAEAKLLATESYREKLAAAIYFGIIDYFCNNAQKR